MGRLFGGWAREEEEDIKNSGLSRLEYLEREEYRRNNRVYPTPPKKAIFRGIDLCVGDMIIQSMKNPIIHLITDFKEDGRPIVIEVSIDLKNRYEGEWKYDELLLIGINAR